MYKRRVHFGEPQADENTFYVAGFGRRRGMKPEVLLKAFVLHKSRDGFVQLVASTVDEVYSRAFRIAQAPPHLVEETVLRVYSELARKAPRLREDVVLAAWLREHTCKAAVKILHEQDRSVDRTVLKQEKQGLAASSDMQAAPPGLATRVSWSILLNTPRTNSLWVLLPRVSWPAWIRLLHLRAGAVCVLGIIVVWNIPFHKRNPIVLSPDLPGLQMTPASYGQLANLDESVAAPPSQTPNTKVQSNP